MKNYRSAIWCSALVFGAGLFFSAHAAQTIVVSTVDELTNAVARATQLGDDGADIVLKPGVYDLSTLSTVCVTNTGKTTLSWGTACAPDQHKNSHLVFNVRLTLRGENTKHWSEKTSEEESVIKGDGSMRLIYPYTGAGRLSRFRHLSFENGHAAASGGALYAMNTDRALEVRLTNCVFRSCSADSEGGATCNLSAFDCLYENNVAPRGGAAMGRCGVAGYPTNIFSHCVFRDNRATGAAFGGGALSCEEFQLIKDCVFSNNVSQVTGAGALAINKPNASARIENCVFADNSGTGNGGALYVNSLLGGIVGSTFTNNVGGTGGAFYSENGVGVVSNNVFVANRTRGGSGGAGYVKARVDKLVDCSFVGNSAGWGGGGFVASGCSIGELARCTFRTNSADVSVGALSIGAAQSLIADCVFEGNSCPTNQGALYVGGELTTLTNCSFIGNHAGVDLASVALTSFDRIVGCTFKDNVAGRNYAGVAVGSMAKSGTIEDCVFDNNTNQFVNVGSQVHYVKQVTGCTFRGYGDMIALNYDRCVFDSCAFDYDNYGGGMIVFNTTTGPGHMRNCLFTNSTAHVYIKNDTGKTVEISNCTFVDNDAITVRNVGASGVNMAPGYIFYAFRGGTDTEHSGKALPSTNLVVNCVFSNNRQNGSRNDVSFYTTATSVFSPAGNIFRNSLYERATVDGYFNNAVKSDLVVGGPNFVAGDARYLGSPYYMIRRSSPARNTGLLLDWMTAEVVDLAGNARVVDGLPDMGCYECDLPITGTMVIMR